MFDVKHGDCLELLNSVDDRSIDLILCDLPYGTTACPWDSCIDLERLWRHYRRVIKPYHAIVLTASQPFTTMLAYSNLAWLRYEWIWVKNRPTNFAHAKNKPMKKHENILVFSEGTTVHRTQSERRMPYYPQGLHDTKSEHEFEKHVTELTDAFFAGRPSHGKFIRKKTHYPHSVLEYATDQLGLHPTAKPIALMEYLIRTYTCEGDTVLDNCCGSGTTGIACARTGRHFMGMEIDADYYALAMRRLIPQFNDLIRS